MALFERLARSIQIGEEKKDELSVSLDNGYTFFNEFNDSRMALAFSSFSVDMKKALFEVIYFLNVNDPKYEKHVFNAIKIEKAGKALREVPVSEEACLYLDKCPAGVAGIGNLSPNFKDEFDEYIQAEFGDTVVEKEGYNPIYSISSLGSIGTVGHKTTASDLDLQVQYELDPFLFKSSDVSDSEIRKRSLNLIKFFSNQYRIRQKIRIKELAADPEKKKKITIVGHKNFKKRFPLLYDISVKGKKDVAKTAFESLGKRQKLMHEITSLYRLYIKTCQRDERREKDELLKRRIGYIQDYVQKKFPKAEVYLFAYSNDDYRDGKHGTTLQSKEASGSAYELILNYETLMPGIQFTPMVPIHFLMPEDVNADREKYEQITDYIRFNITDLYRNYDKELLDLGSTPPLTLEYMTAHAGAVYWESFKASSGNLPKAMLNLLRLEMLFDSRFNTSIIELIKNPSKFNHFISPDTEQEEEIEEEEEEYDDVKFIEEEENFFDSYGIDHAVLEDDDDVIGGEDSANGLSLNKVLKIEEEFPLLLKDPWWLRYKALKIGFGPRNENIQEAERNMISRVIDLGFALHIRVSDVFVEAGEKKQFKTYREQVMVRFLEKAFPQSRRKFLEHIFWGDVDAVIKFEKDLKLLFKNSLYRVLKVVDQSEGGDKTNREEFAIWYHYYKTHFEPGPNVITMDILTHLKEPRGRLQIGINKKRKWFFKSIQKSAFTKSRYDTFGSLDHLPDEVELFDHKSFLHGIGHCLLNGYYGVLNKGTLMESRTHVEFSVGSMSLGKRSADLYAFVRPDIVVRLVDSISQAFPPQDYDFRDCINKTREVVDIFICFNLLEFGRISIIYRDNLKTWYVDEFNHPQVEKVATKFYDSGKMLIEHTDIQNTIGLFLDKHSFILNDETRENLHCWINPNSIKTHHSNAKFKEKEKELSKKFARGLYQLFGAK